MLAGSKEEQPTATDVTDVTQELKSPSTLSPLSPNSLQMSPSPTVTFFEPFQFEEMDKQTKNFKEAAQSIQPKRSSNAPPLSYNPLNLLNFPRRIFCPPKIALDTEGYSPSGISIFRLTAHRQSYRPEQKYARSARNLTFTPLIKVHLEDVIAGRFLAPISASDFETFLMATHCVENLYFYHYCSAYLRACEQINSNSDVVIDLYKFSSQLVHRFIQPGASMELNLTYSVREKVMRAHSEGTKSLSAEDLVPVNEAVLEMMESSLKNFLAKAHVSAGRKRTIFALSVGVVSILAAVALVVALRITREQNLWALTAAPLFFVGILTFFCGINHMCIVIFMVGDARQLHSYEYYFKDIDDKMSQSNSFSSASTAAEKHLQNVWDIEAQWAAVSPVLGHGTNTNAQAGKNDASLRSRSTSYESSCSPASTHNSRDVWAPLVQILDPRVKRCQWVVFIRSCFTAFVTTTIILIAACLIR